MSRTVWIRVVLAVAIALAALFFIRLHNAGGASSDSATAGYRLATAWCKDCHSIEPATAGAITGPPDFTGIANRHSTTALSLRVFLQTSHPTMPNLILKPDETDSLVNYILSLKRN
ncbi:cytochrome c [Bradyrhizobium sp.]|uniref:c-type cytochrome n=1 Tax=Bradyrhizobium sp. TaxID=376 RepID=UPI0025BC05F6|nr:cytochrome c [Bradyrhizobium sp.]